MSNQNKGRKKSPMSEVLRETVPEAALDVLRQNTRFITERDGKTVYVTMLLQAESIGGLSKKEARNQTKGQLVEMINTSKIKTFLTPRLLQNESIVFIPEAETLKYMEEFSILVKAPYVLAYVTDDAEVNVSKTQVEFKDIKDYANGVDTIEDFLVYFEVPWILKQLEAQEAKAQAEAFARPETKVAKETGVKERVSDNTFTPAGAPFGDEEYLFDASPDVGAGFDENYDDGTVYEMTTQNLDDLIDEETNYEEVPEFEDEDFYEEEELVEIIDPIDANMFNDTLRRVFYSDDLGLEVTTEAFDTQFVRDNPYIEFEEDRGEGWLNNQLSLISQQANNELNRLHHQNLLETREMYFNLLQDSAENIKRQFDEFNPKTLAGEHRNRIEREYATAQEELERSIGEKKSQANADFKAKADEAGEEARLRGIQEYRERFRRQHEDELARIEPQMRNALEAKYQGELRSLRDERRQMAAKEMDAAINGALEQVSDEYKERIAKEQALYESYKNQIMEVIEDNRKNDIAVNQVRAEELAQQREADKVLAEYTERLDSQRAGFEARREELEAEIESLRRSKEDALKEQSASHEEKILLLNTQLGDSEEKIRELLDGYNELDAKKAEEYRVRLETKEAERLELANAFDEAVSANRRGNVIGVALALIGMVMAMFIGIVYGMRSGNFMLENEQPALDQAILQEIEDRVNNMDAEDLVEEDLKDIAKAKAEAEKEAESIMERISEVEEKAKELQAENEGSKPTEESQELETKAMAESEDESTVPAIQELSEDKHQDLRKRLEEIKESQRQAQNGD